MSEFISKPAVTVVPIAPLLAHRWSPRVFDKLHVLSHGDVLALAEAARWAPSSNNAQPWKISIVLRESREFEAISKSGLTGFNQSWAPAASGYVVVMADKLKPDGSPWDQAISFYNAGLMSAQVVFQAEHMGLKAHYMGGILHAEIEKILSISDSWVVNVIAIGLQGDPSGAVNELAEREQASRTRKDLSEILIHGFDG